MVIQLIVAKYILRSVIKDIDYKRSACFFDSLILNAPSGTRHNFSLSDVQLSTAISICSAGKDETNSSSISRLSPGIRVM